MIYTVYIFISENTYFANDPAEALICYSGCSCCAVLTVSYLIRTVVGYRGYGYSDCSRCAVVRVILLYDDSAVLNFLQLQWLQLLCSGYSGLAL